MNVFTIRGARKKSAGEDYRDARCKHIEAWREQSNDARRQALGENAFDDAQALYLMRGSSGTVPSFRPQIQVPELQKILLEDSNRISDISPQIYIFNDGEAAEERERAIQAAWTHAHVNYHLLYSTLISRYCGMGFLQLCFDPNMRNGRGQVWTKSRLPNTVGFDPTTDYEFDPSYIFWEDWLHPEEIRKRWYHASKDIKNPQSTAASSTVFQNSTGYGFQMPPGPMAAMPGMPSSGEIGRTTNDTRWRVTHCICKDYTREVVDKKNLPDGNLTDPEFKWRYPNGRYLVECQGHILADGPNPFPQRTDIPAPFMGLVPVWALPPLYGPWGVPVTRFSQSLQSMGEKLYTQLFENAVRLNNGTWFIDKGTGIDIEQFGGIPGEVQEINPNSRVPEMRTVTPLPGQAYQLPGDVFKIQQRLLGQTEAKQGNPGQGNVSTSLFESSILQSSGLLQLSGRLQSFSVYMIGSGMFYTMGRYVDRYRMPFRGDKGMETALWEGILDPHNYDLLLDEDSIQPLSEVALRRMVPDLMKTGILNTERGLQILGIPHAEKIAEEHRQTLELQALARLKGRK